MSTALVPVREARPALTLVKPPSSVANILATWYAGKSPQTLRSYVADLARFATFLSERLAVVPPLSATEALDRLFATDSATAHGVVLEFRAAMLDRNRAPATINRALATLRSVSKLARMLGVVNGNWYLEVGGVAPERRRDTRGPTTGDVQRMIAATAGDTETALRDAAIVTTFFGLGLRVSELCALTLEETDLPRGTVWVKGKGRRERELLPLSAPVVTALRAYVRLRGSAPGPLFKSRSRRRGRDAGGAATTRLHPSSVLAIVSRLGRQIGRHVWCHALRHTAITEAIVQGQRQGIGLDQIRAFSRHRAIATMLIYRDEHDRAATHRQLVEVVGASLTVAAAPKERL